MKKTYKISHSFDCNEKCLIYHLSCKSCSKQDVGNTTDHFRSRWTCYVLSGFRNSSLIIQLSLLLSFSKYIRLRQYYELPFIVRDLRHISASYVNCEQSLRQEL